MPRRTVLRRGPSRHGLMLAVAVLFIAGGQTRPRMSPAVPHTTLLDDDGSDDLVASSRALGSTEPCDRGGEP